MKKILAFVLALSLALTLVISAAAESTVMTYADFTAAAIDDEVTVETYIQAKQGWWENEGVGNASFYTQSEDGAYFLYNMPCTEEEYAQLVPGTKIKVTGVKAQWPEATGEIEIIEATFEIEEGEFIAEATDVTELFGTDELANEMNKFISVKGATVAAANDEGAAFLYNWDGSGEDGNDL